MANKQPTDEFIDDLLQPISDIYESANYKVLSIITNRIRSIGELSATDAGRLSILLKNKDLKEIEKILSDATELSVKEIDSIVTKSAEYNDELSESLYKARNLTPATIATDSALLSVANAAKKNMVDSVVNLSNTTSFLINGKMTSIAKTYNYAINRAAFEVQQGLFDYNSSMRSVIKELADSGIRTVDFESGYSRRLDSQAMLNVREGISRLNEEYRAMQGSQFGADGIELSVHSLSEPIHAQYQGRQFSLKEFERIQNSLQRRFFTNNCRHASIQIILGISEPTYSEKELAEINAESNKQVEYTTRQKDADGNYIKKKLPKYQATQVQRNLETEIRKLKDYKNQIDILGDKTESNIIQKKIAQKTKYYKSVSEQVGISPRMERTRIVKESKNISDVKTVKKGNFVFPVSDYKQLKSVQDCEEFAKSFVSNGVPMLSKKSIDFSGLDIEQSNALCKTLNNIFRNTKIDKPSSIEVFGKKNRKYFEKHEKAPMATTNFGNFLINKEICKTRQDIVSYLDEGKSAFDLCIKNKSKFSGSKLKLIEKYEKAGKQLVGDSFEDMIVHETGHLLSYSKEFNKPLAEIMNNTNWMEYTENLSGYSSHSFGEYIAESWSSFYKYGEDNLQPEILELFKKVVVKWK